MRPLNLEGQRFGALVAIARAPNRGPKAAWSCKCDCGAVHVATVSNLVSGHISSCGCLCAVKVTHGMARTKTYRSWAGAKARCRNKKNTNYPHYGGRGIDMCERWAESFEAFLSDMGKCPDGMSIERIDTNGNYEPGNCKWVPISEQCMNTRVAMRWVVKGLRFQSRAEAAKHFNVSDSAISWWCNGNKSRGVGPLPECYTERKYA